MNASRHSGKPLWYDCTLDTPTVITTATTSTSIVIKKVSKTQRVFRVKGSLRVNRRLTKSEFVTQRVTQGK